MIISVRAILAMALACVAASAAELPADKRILFIGDSITYSGQYVTYVETYCRTRNPEFKSEILTVGLPSETVSELSEDGHAGGKFPRPHVHERLGRVLEKIKPDLVIACYGMNCGIYLPLADERFSKYKDGINRVREQVLKSGAKIVHVTPPIFDGVKGKNPHYAAVLDKYSEWLVGQRGSGWEVIDLHTPMNVYQAAQQAKNPDFTLANDGVHPNETGHWLMAKAILQHFGAKDLDAVTDAKQMLPENLRSSELLKLVAQRQAILRDAWLTETKHVRPGINAGLPLAEAQAKAAEIDTQLRALIK